MPGRYQSRLGSYVGPRARLGRHIADNWTSERENEEVVATLSKAFRVQPTMLDSSGPQHLNGFHRWSRGASGCLCGKSGFYVLAGTGESEIHPQVGDSEIIVLFIGTLVLITT